MGSQRTYPSAPDDDPTGDLGTERDDWSVDIDRCGPMHRERVRPARFVVAATLPVDSHSASHKGCTRTGTQCPPSWSYSRFWPGDGEQGYPRSMTTNRRVPLLVGALLLAAGCAEVDGECSNTPDDVTWTIEGNLQRITHCPQWINAGDQNSIGWRIERQDGNAIIRDMITITWVGEGTGSFPLGGLSSGATATYSGGYNGDTVEFTGPGTTGMLDVTAYDVGRGLISGTFAFQVNLTAIEDGQFRDVELDTGEE